MTQCQVILVIQRKVPFMNRLTLLPLYHLPFFFPLFYSYSVHGPRNKEVIMNLVQKEVEKCDRLSGFFTIMSMAGGTGSGLGAFVTQCLRDAFPSSFILNHVIWPYGTGEVNVVFPRDILQDYNCDHRGTET